jgi:hypothetical protein
VSSPRAWCVVHERHRNNPFGPYATREEAESVARELRRIYPGNRYEIRRDPDFLVSDIPPSGLAPAPAYTP